MHFVFFDTERVVYFHQQCFLNMICAFFFYPCVFFVVVFYAVVVSIVRNKAKITFTLSETP